MENQWAILFYTKHIEKGFFVYNKNWQKINLTIFFKKVVCTSSSFSSSSSSSVDPTVSKVWREKSSMMTAAQKTWKRFNCTLTLRQVYLVCRLTLKPTFKHWVVKTIKISRYTTINKLPNLFLNNLAYALKVKLAMS